VGATDHKRRPVWLRLVVVWLRTVDKFDLKSMIGRQMLDTKERDLVLVPDRLSVVTP
jgi:hypothetical protein